MSSAKIMQQLDRVAPGRTRKASADATASYPNAASIEVFIWPPKEFYATTPRAPGSQKRTLRAVSSMVELLPHKR